jgi:hypothetical protein
MPWSTGRTTGPQTRMTMTGLQSERGGESWNSRQVTRSLPALPGPG